MKEMINLFLQQEFTFKGIIGTLLIITGIFDAWKYIWESRKIKQVGTAKGHSRKFINMALTNDLVRIIYSIILWDYYLMFINAIALTCMINLWITIYRFYPYRCRGLMGFKKPNIILYLLNSIVPNKIRKRL